MLAWLLPPLLLQLHSCSQRVIVAHPFLRPPAARIVIRWQQCVLGIDDLFDNTAAAAAAAAALALFDDSRRSPTMNWMRTPRAPNARPRAPNVRFARRQRRDKYMYV